MGERLATLGRVATDETLRRVGVTFAGFSLAETATWLAMVVYAFGRGGTSEAGLVSVLALVTAMFVAPFAAYAGDRFAPHIALAVGYLAQGVTMVGAGVAMWVDQHAVAYAAACLVAGAVTFTRPVIASLLPSISHLPADLVAANVVLSTVENLGVFVGPLAAAVLLQVGPELVMATFGIAMCLASAAVSRLPVVLLSAQVSTETMTLTSLHRRVMEGVSTLVHDRVLRLLVFIMSISAVSTGLVDVLIVAVAEDRLDGTVNVGVLAASVGAGALVGTLGSTALAGRGALAPWVVAAAVSIASGVIVAGTAGNVLAVVIALITVGAGESILLVLGKVALQRFAPEDVLTRLFGVNESLQMLAMAAGAGAFALLSASVALHGTVMILAAVMAASVALSAWRLRVSGGDVAPPPPTLVGRLHRDPVFAVLDVRSIERLANGSRTELHHAGATVITEGDVGESYYLVVSGRVEATVAGAHKRFLDSTESFGEIALLRDVPRTASVTCRTPTELLVIDRGLFLAAVTGHSVAMSTVSEIADRYEEP